jgi:hypothetical protein
MYTYQLQPRHLKLATGKQPEFPATVSIELTLSPPHVFGGEAGPLGIILKGSSLELAYDANADRVTSVANPPLSRVSIVREAMGGRFILDGANLTFEFDCASAKDLSAVMETLRLSFPAILTLFIRDPVYIGAASAKIGPSSVRSEHIGTAAPLLAITQESYTELLESALESCEILFDRANARLLAAIQYFHVAERLANVGASPWEFTSEVILNLYKSLEVLFGRSRDDLRSALSALGIPDVEIEGHYVALMILRDKLDVGHARMNAFTRGQLKTVYSFVKEAPSFMRSLLQDLLKRVEGGTWTVPSAHAAPVKKSSQLEIERLVASMELASESERNRMKTSTTDEPAG